MTPTPPEGLAEYPSGIAVNADGRVWITGRPWSSPPVLPPPDPRAPVVAVYGDGVLTKYAFETIPGWPADLVDRTLSVNGTPTKTVTFPGPILAAPDGRIWFGACTVTFPSGANGRQDGTLSVLEGALGGPNRTLSLRTVRTGACPEGLAYAHSTLWFTEPGAYAIGSVDKRLLTKPAFVPTDLHPTGPIVATPSGIWFAGKTGASSWLGVNPDPNHEGLGQLHPDGTVSAYLTSVTPGFNGSGVDGLTVGPDGNVWFTEAGGAGAIAHIQLGIASGKKQR